MNTKYLIFLPLLILNTGLLWAGNGSNDSKPTKTERNIFEAGLAFGFRDGLEEGFRDGLKKGLNDGIIIGSGLTIAVSVAGYCLCKAGKSGFGYLRNPLKYGSERVIKRLDSKVPGLKLSPEAAKLKLVSLGDLVKPTNPIGNEAYIRACDCVEARGLSKDSKFNLAQDYARQICIDSEKLS